MSNSLSDEEMIRLAAALREEDRRTLEATPENIAEITKVLTILASAGVWGQDSSALTLGMATLIGMHSGDTEENQSISKTMLAQRVEIKASLMPSMTPGDIARAQVLLFGIFDKAFDRIAGRNKPPSPGWSR